MDFMRFSPDYLIRLCAPINPVFCLFSSEYCEQHLQLLFTILEKSHFPIVRANAVVALGDLTMRFPNLIEPWTTHIYGRLAELI